MKYMWEIVCHKHFPHRLSFFEKDKFVIILCENYDPTFKKLSSGKASRPNNNRKFV